MGELAMRFLMLPIWLATGAVAIGGQPLKWSDSSGEFHVEAEFVTIHEGIVKLRKPDGAEVVVPFDRLDETSRRAVDRLRKPATGNPFMAAVAPDAKPAEPDDSTKRTAKLLTEIREQIDKGVEQAAALDTSEKRSAAERKAIAAAVAKVKDKPLAFRLTIKDVFSGQEGTTFTVAHPESIDADWKGRDQITIRTAKDEAAKINAGDVLTLTGKATLTEGSLYSPPSGQGVGVIVCVYSPGDSGRGYFISIRGLAYRIEHKK